MKNRNAWVGLALWAVAGVASAQNLPAFDLERLTLDPAAHGSLVIGDGEVGPAGSARFSLALHFERQPLVVTSSGLERGLGQDSPYASIVKDRLTLHLGLAVALTDWLELDGRLPYVAWQDRDGGALAARGVASPAQSGLGTPSVGLKLRLLSQSGGSPLNVALAGDVLPDAGASEAVAGNDRVEFTPRLELGHRFDGFVVGAQAGALVRTKPVFIPDARGGGVVQGRDLRSELQGGLAVSTAGHPVTVELSGRGSWNFDGLGQSYELLGGVRWKGRVAELFALGGPGFGPSPGTPQYRGLLGFAVNINPAPPPPPAPVAEPEAPAPPPPPPPDPCAEGNPHTPEQCPALDDDGDGIPNGQDACPLVKGIPENHGCPDVDTDGDGIPDRLDKCPNEPGTAEYQGCPPPKAATLDEGAKKITLRESIYFDTGKATIQERSHGILNDVASVLTAHPEVQKVAIEGHTDATGDKRRNQALSEARAKAVRDYLVAQGIDASRLDPKGFGQTRPIADNKTKAGREKNRRVDFIVE